MEYQSKVLDKEIRNEEFTASSLVEEKQNEIKAHFFFSDVDFDGEDEFVINRYKSGSRESNAYDV